MAKVVSNEITGKKEKYWITYIKQRIRQNKNFLGFVSGPTGSGKSYSSLRICQDLDPEFNIDRVVFSAKELMNVINSGNLRRGSCILFEEAGVGVNTRNWQSVINKVLGYLIQTFRHRNYILIMNAPYMDFIDSSLRKLFHAEFTTVGIDRKTNEVKLKAQTLQYNARMGKMYYKRLKVITREGKVPISIWRVTKPSGDLLKLYEEKKTAYTTKLNQDILAEIEAQENKSKKKSELTEVQQRVLELLKEGKSVPEIAKIRDRASQAIRESIAQMRNKGYKIDPIRDREGHVKHYDVTEPGQTDNPYNGQPSP